MAKPSTQMVAFPFSNDYRFDTEQGTTCKEVYIRSNQMEEKQENIPSSNTHKRKSLSALGGFERRERDKGGFFDSQSCADEFDSWVLNKSFVSLEGWRFSSNDGGERRVVGFGSSGDTDSDNWNNKKKSKSNIGSSESVGVGGRLKLVLQPRTLSVSNEGDR
ncbi:hypothetical protein JHK82_033525 [Glycine max]|nr:hypothetical protein JHK85_034242 [Glycine max]KAG4985921.1 hypothetical protein JHK86_033612 [Glycine max]KAG5119105.1 hypothetical protein JHK82_033525 [Glycine max]KAG5140094.1 hypothetical protein JHK84_033862 [Glycine max]